MGRAMKVLVASATFTFLAVVTRGFVIWLHLEEPYLTFELLLRSGGFLTLFAFAYFMMRGWSNLAKN